MAEYFLLLIFSYKGSYDPEGIFASADTKNISRIVNSGLCTGCGTCVPFCPESAICLVMDNKQLIYSPRIDSAKCTHCGLCLRVCSGHSVDFEELSANVFGDQSISRSVLLGGFIRCYSGYSRDHETRVNSSSGGMITQLLVLALEEGLIDGALVSKMQEKKPFEPVPFIARSKQEIHEGSKSK